MDLNNPLILLLVFPLVGYLIGSTPFGVLLARAKGVNLREVGSGNVGATNVARALGRGWGYGCFVLDVAKGLVPTYLAGRLIGPAGEPTILQQAGWLGMGLGCVLGHVFSFYLRGRGGKGVATSLGVVLGVFPYFTGPGLIAFGVWIVVTLVTRYVSLGSVVAAVAFLPAFVLWNWPVGRYWPLTAFAAAVVALILLRHRANISRLLAGAENKIGHKRAE